MARRQFGMMNNPLLLYEISMHYVTRLRIQFWRVRYGWTLHFPFFLCSLSKPLITLMFWHTGCKTCHWMKAERTSTHHPQSRRFTRGIVGRYRVVFESDPQEWRIDDAGVRLRLGTVKQNKKKKLLRNPQEDRR